MKRIHTLDICPITASHCDILLDACAHRISVFSFDSIFETHPTLLLNSTKKNSLQTAASRNLLPLDDNHIGGTCYSPVAFNFRWPTSDCDYKSHSTNILKRNDAKTYLEDEVNDGKGANKENEMARKKGRSMRTEKFYNQIRAYRLHGKGISNIDESPEGEPQLQCIHLR